MNSSLFRSKPTRYHFNMHCHFLKLGHQARRFIICSSVRDFRLDDGQEEPVSPVRRGSRLHVIICTSEMDRSHLLSWALLGNSIPHSLSSKPNFPFRIFRYPQDNDDAAEYDSWGNYGKPSNSHSRLGAYIIIDTLHSQTTHHLLLSVSLSAYYVPSWSEWDFTIPCTVQEVISPIVDLVVSWVDPAFGWL